MQAGGFALRLRKERDKMRGKAGSKQAARLPKDCPKTGLREDSDIRHISAR